MKDIKIRRKEFMGDLIKFFNLLDPSGDNSKSYHDLFNKMSDDEFDKYMIEFFNNDKANFYLEIIEFDRDLKLENIEKCADAFGIPLYEHVAMPYLNGTSENVSVTPFPVPVGYIHEKRMQQTLLKKNSGSIDISKRNPKTGQVVNDDKNARNSDVETFSLIAIGANEALKEFMGPRADDLYAKNQMYNNISKNGYAALDELTNEPENKVALNTLDVYFLMQGISTNLVSPLNLLPESKKKN